jgi:glutamine synthetase
MDKKQIKALIEENEVQAIDLKYCGLDGKWYHITFPARRLDFVLEHGVPFDGSSIPGMRDVESGDMVLMPDLATAAIDPFYETPTLRLICSICDAETRIGVKKDPRSVAHRAHEYMLKTGIADNSTWIPELEFHLFDGMETSSDSFSSATISPVAKAKTHFRKIGTMVIICRVRISRLITLIPPLIDSMRFARKWSI